MSGFQRSICTLLAGSFATLLLLSGTVSAGRQPAAAAAVLGQRDLQGAACNDPALPPAARLCDPRGVAVDHLGRLYVADSGNHRLLRWPDADSFESGQPAELVIGQPDFATMSCNRGGPPGAATLCAPSAVGVDRAGNLYVVDTGNSRVLRYSPPTASGPPADLVLGQVDFDGSACNAGGAQTASTLCEPRGLAINETGDRLYVADGRNRVLEYRAPARNGQAAELALGQANFGRNHCNYVFGQPRSYTLCAPLGLALDRAGNLYVADSANSRVLKFAPPFAMAHAAGLVVGQDSFLAVECNRGGPVRRDTLCHPSAVAVDRKGALRVADAGNARLLRYRKLRVDGQAATAVVGQPDFLESLPGRGPAGLDGPAALAVDRAGNLYVADARNHRVIRFNRPKDE